MNLRYKKSVLLAHLFIILLGVKAISQNCTNGLDTIEQVTVLVACQDSFTILWPAHSTNCYKVTVGTGVNNVEATGSLTIAKDAVGVSTHSKISIIESCGGLASDPCTNTTGIDTFMAVVPPLDSAGLWSFVRKGETGSGTMMTPSGSAAFTANSPTNIPDVSTDAGLIPSTTNVIRPTCNSFSDGTFDVLLNFTAGSIDSLTHSTIRVDNSAIVQPSATADVLNDSQTSHTINVTGTIAAGVFETKVIIFSGVCIDSITQTSTVGEGSNEPVVACNSDLNIAVEAACMVDLNVGMILAGQSSPCVATLMDSLVVKLTDGTVVMPITYPVSGRFDTIRILDASLLINVPLVLEVHSSGGGVSNTCWGNLLLEDKLAPVLMCDTSFVVSCFDFTFGGNTSHIIAMDCDTNPTINMINQQIITNCSNDSIVKRLIRTFNAVDKYGNVSTTCTDTLNVRRLDADLTNNTATGGVLDIEGLMMPLDYLVNNDPTMPNDTTPFICDDNNPFADVNKDGIPDPIDFLVNATGDTLYGAGVPKIDTIINGVQRLVKFFPSNVTNPDSSVAQLLEICKTVTTVRDVPLPAIGCVKKVVRTWTISEWVCNKETTLEFRQTIEIQDTAGPIIVVPTDMKVTTNQNDCTRRMQIPPLVSISDQCAFNGTPTKVTVIVVNNGVLGSISTDNGTYSATTGGVLNIPLGLDTVIYTAFDDCHNVTTDTIIIEVADETAPVMICKEFVTVSLSNNSRVKLPAQSANNGSFDDCTMESLCIARMVDLNGFDSLRMSGNGGLLTDGTAYVVLDSLIGACGRQFYKSGTINGIDYIVKSDICTPHVEYCCEDGGIQDTVVLRAIDHKGNANQCMVQVNVQDKRRPILHCPPDITIDCKYSFVTDSIYSIFGNVVAQGQQKAINIPANQVLVVESGKSLVDGVWSGNCDAQISVVAKRVSEKCSGGTIERIFTISANGFSSSCVQNITMKRAIPIDKSKIVFPNDTTIIACGDPNDYGPDVTGRPFVNEEGCSLLGDSHEDLTVRSNNPSGDACFSIIREWSIIDWCEEPPKVISSKSQIIKLIDNEDPMILNGGICKDTTFSVSTCSDGAIFLQIRGTDQCTNAENLIWIVDIDLNNDGTIDETKKITPTVENSQSVAALTGSYPHGKHRAVWKLNDQCGNTTSCEQLFTIINGIQPNTICRTSITGPLTPITSGEGQIVVWADEYNIGSSSHPCGYEIVYSFSQNAIIASVTLTCAEFKPPLGADSSVVDMAVYVLATIISDNNGVKDTSIVSASLCNSTFVLYDSQFSCNNGVAPPNNGNVLIAGNIRTHGGQNIATVNVDLEGVNSSASTIETVTDINGMYAFPSMTKGESYVLNPNLNNDILNGVSTLDLVLIQKHILGLEPLDSPYKIIAADANNDKNISAIDMIEMRKVILNVSDAFTNNTSWRFVDASHEFRKERDPLNENFDTKYTIQKLERDMDIDFIGVKTGDVNETVDVAGLITSPRISGAIEIIDQYFSLGETILIPIKMTGAAKIVGYQYALKYDSEILQFSGYSGDHLNLTTDNFSVKDPNDGLLLSSWNDHQGIITKGENLFILEFKAKRSGRLSDILKLDHSILNTEMYSDDLSTISLGLNFIPGESMSYGEHTLFQNSPNPFSEYTEISFILPSEGKGSLKLFDINGKLLKEYNDHFSEGINRIIISKRELAISSGVVIYSFESVDFSDTKEMIIVE
ncbi:MAG: cohesin domain-containing protein [Saprospiraceae bacterium]